MILINALILDETFQFVKRDVGIHDGRIVFGESQQGEALDLSGMYLIPGLIDTHIHGANGGECDNGSTQELDLISSFLAKNGVTTFAPTIRTLALPKMLDAVKEIRRYANPPGAKVGGIHLEGPFVAPKGALLREYMIKPSPQVMKQFVQEGEGLVKLITLAPELEGIDEVISYAVSHGVVVSLGHSDADYQTAKHAHALGATQLTHTFNAIRPLNHHEPGVLDFSLTEHGMICELICDFIHLHPAAVKLVYEAKGDQGINMISDSCLAAGLGDGVYEVGPQKRTVKDGKVTLENGTIAGGSKTLLDGVRNVVSLGIGLESAVKTASINPAKTLGIDHETGSIADGKRADLVALDENLQVKYVLIDGVKIKL